MNKDRRAINLQAVDWDRRDLLEEIATLRTRLEEAERERDDRRMSLAQEIAGALKARGLYCPKDFNSPDIIQAVGLALESLSEHRLNFDLAREAERRGEEMFLDAHPEYRERLALPGTDRLVCWLLEQLVDGRKHSANIIYAITMSTMNEKLAAHGKIGRLRDVNYDLRVTNADLANKLLDWESREGSCCPEDFGFEEYIASLQKQLTAAQARAERAERAMGPIKILDKYIDGVLDPSRPLPNEDAWQAIREAIRLANEPESVTSEE